MKPQMRLVLMALSEGGWTPLRAVVRPGSRITDLDLMRMIKRGLIEGKQLPDNMVHVRITSYGRVLVKGKACV
jgi:hypothetical protein